MKVTEEIEKIIANGYSDEDMLIKEDELQEFYKGISKLSNSYEKKGYMIPLVDTIGMNLKEKLSFQIKDIS